VVETTEVRLLVNLFYPMLVTGLLTSAHCVMMCGNMVLSYAVKGSEDGSLARRMLPHGAYHSAKILSYTLVGLLLGSVGAFISQGARSWVSVVAGVYMVLLGLNMTGKFPQLNKLTPRPPRFLITALSRMRRKSKTDAAAGDASLGTPLTFGLMTGLMPCGPLIAAQVAAAGTGSALSGGLAMLGFGLGTAPLMLGYGAVASYMGVRFKKYMAVAGAVVIIALGLVMLNRGATALGSPVTFNTVKQTVLGGSPVAVDESQFKTGADGVVEVPLVIENVQYQPSTLAIPADKPVRLIVDRREDNACSEQLLIPNLGIQVPLKANGQTIVDIPATKAGSFQMTCQMGMMAGSLQVGSAVAKARTNLVPLGLLALAFTGGYWLYTRQLAAKREAEEAERHQRGRKKNPSLKPSPSSGLLGLSPSEVLLTGAALLLAAFIGLMLGGYFA
jgi:sulfite exporter TauE/SafE